ncbi:hypothetical protein E5S69_29625 [Cupriavidus necator]|uniref:hypothetical protein n=1 Tax=Cupriavidus necator TaxID=106590 RepID=UPI00148FF42C|nr:hypothetical protein [Cupriavidus necator]NOV27648.1 hypothetical protein [Cupriavidus necator]
MMNLLATLILGATLAVSGCTYYGYPPGTAVPASYDRSFFAAADAMRDQDVVVSTQDQAGGTVVGQRQGTGVTATVRQQPDGSVRVQFSASDSRDPGLLDRISRSYDRRMGR